MGQTILSLIQMVLGLLLEKTDKIFLNEQYRSSHIFFDLQKENMGQTLFSLIKIVFRNV